MQRGGWLGVQNYSNNSLTNINRKWLTSNKEGRRSLLRPRQLVLEPLVFLKNNKIFKEHFYSDFSIFLTHVIGLYKILPWNIS